MHNTQQMADALGLTLRTVQRDLRAGMPKPRRGESLEAWAPRARAWKAEHRRRPGRPPDREASPTQQDAETRYRLAKAELAELQLAQAKGELHSRIQCDETRARQCAELLAAFKHLPDSLARKLYQAPSPDAIKLVVQEEIRRCFEVLADGERADAVDARGPSVA